MNYDPETALKRIGKAWFVSRAYSDYVDPTHKNWNNSEIEDSLKMRESYYQSTKSFHKDLLKLILRSNPASLSRNTIGLSGISILEMARKILETISI